MRAELLKGLTEAQIEKLKACKNNEEILMAAKEEGLELTDEQLEAVSGGACVDVVCPKCGTLSIGYVIYDGVIYYNCKDCGHEWSEIDD